MLSIHKERVYRCSVERLWAAVATREGLSGWLMKCDFEPAAGHAFTFVTKPAPGFDGVVRCEVIDIREPELLTIAWRSGSLDTRVTFRIDRVDAEHARLRVDHEGFSGLYGAFVRTMLSSGWGFLLKKHLVRWIREHAAESEAAS